MFAVPKTHFKKLYRKIVIHFCNSLMSRTENRFGFEKFNNVFSKISTHLIFAALKEVSTSVSETKKNENKKNFNSVNDIFSKR